MTSIAVIPARTGSKRFPQKNYSDIFGIPSAIRVLDSAFESQCFDFVVISVDQDIYEFPEILELFASYQTRLDFKLHIRNSSAGYSATVNDVCTEVLEEIDDVSIITCLYATAPFRGSEDIKSVFRLVSRSCAEVAFAAVEIPFSPNDLWQTNGSRVEPYFHGDLSKRCLLADNGSTYVASVEFFLKYGWHLDGAAPFVMPLYKGLDIDYEEDLDLLLKLNDRSSFE